MPGIVTNVTKFGAFVDIGVHQDGLVHISQLADRFVKDPAEVVKPQQRVTVTVLEVDCRRKRISLSLTRSCTARQRRRWEKGTHNTRHRMIDYPVIIFAALVTFTYGLVSRLSERSPITAPMVFAAIGILAGPLVLDLFEVKVTAAIVRLVAEVALVLILFVDASTVDLQGLRAYSGIPVRLLGVGLPLTMVLGFLVAAFLPGYQSLWLAGLVALVLSPTDAALGQAVVTSKLLPVRIRQAINVESGLNDGIALPPILMCLAALAAGENHGAHSGSWLSFLLRQLTLGPLAGILIGWCGGWLVDMAGRRNWMQPTFQRLVAGSLAVLVYAGAESIHGNGFIAAYCAGLFLGNANPRHSGAHSGIW